MDLLLDVRVRQVVGRHALSQNRSREGHHQDADICNIGPPLPLSVRDQGQDRFLRIEQDLRRAVPDDEPEGTLLVPHRHRS